MENLKPSLPSTEKSFFSNVKSYIKKPFKSIFKQFKDVLLPILSLRGWVVMVASTVILKLTSMESVKDFITTLWGRPADAIAKKINPNYKDKAEKKEVIEFLVKAGYDKYLIQDLPIEKLKAEKAKLNPKAQQATKDAARKEGLSEGRALAKKEAALAANEFAKVADGDIKSMDINNQPEGDVIVIELGKTDVAKNIEDYTTNKNNFVKVAVNDQTGKLLRENHVVNSASTGKTVVADDATSEEKTKVAAAKSETTSTTISAQASTTT